MDGSTWAHVAAGRFHDLAPEDLRELCALELLVPAEQDELSVIVARRRAAVRDDPVLYVVVQPTAACQLGCHYCGQKHSPGALTDELESRLLREVEQRLARSRARILEVSWFGAEPLLAIGSMRRLTTELKRMATDRRVEYRAKIVTNGVLLSSEKARILFDELHVARVEVTLDGPPELHDARRMTKGGGDTFNVIYANLTEVAQWAPDHTAIVVRCNVDRSNADGVAPLFRRIAADGLQSRVNFYAAFVRSWGNDAHLGALTLEEFGEREIAWMAELHDLGFRIQLIPSLKPITCMATRQHSVLVDAYGEMFNCTEVSYVPAYGTPNRYRIGDLASGETDGARNDLGAFGTTTESLESLPCGSCEMLPVCGGSCPKQWQEGHTPCPSAKANMGRRLQLQYELTHADR